MEDIVAAYDEESILIMNQVFCDLENWERWYDLACYYRIWGNYAAAQQYFKYALVLDPANEEIQQELNWLSIAK
ncbi:hypothetical protein [Candidatus Lokiarchaeum ossiferum]|uniref:hypothetical protein n=1 Tax=Candidatus Lokiarchaeum ossiferum TaxID=2951803 RepID=UPI00352F9DDB